MEAPEEVMGSHSSSSTGECPCPSASPSTAAVFKRKRTKRLRAFPSPPPTASSTSSVDLSTTTEEDEATAHCLILLAQGRALNSPPLTASTEKFTSRRFTETITTAGGKAGFYVYECRTCNKCFPSFQALGGHRASHKKPRLAGPTDDKPSLVALDDDASLDISLAALPKPQSGSGIGIGPGGKLRVHECSICGSEFSSGQALGGHMRRHRPIGATAAAADSQHQQHEARIKENNKNNMLSLDLNLPAPSEDLNSNPPTMPPSFPLPDKRPLLFTATSALVDCHY